jgi:calcineurin-like phosphoesterase family protein
MTRYFTSDHHFWHRNVIKYCNRPYNSVEEMNEGMVHNWNEVVKPEDEVIVVGDFSMAFRSVELYTNRLMGRKILVAGNHDFCHPAHKKSRNPENQKLWIQKYLDAGWAEVHMSMTLELPEIGLINVSHLPYKNGGDSGYEERYQEHRLEDDGKFLICGHVHEKWKTKNKQVNVGVDVWDFRPVSEEMVVKTMLAAV